MVVTRSGSTLSSLHLLEKTKKRKKTSGKNWKLILNNSQSMNTTSEETEDMSMCTKQSDPFITQNSVKAMPDMYEDSISLPGIVNS